MIGNGESIRLPKHESKADFEGELGGIKKCM
jgi:hypothetical protein